MKLFKKRQSSRAFLIAGTVLILLGFAVILCCYGTDDTLNEFDVIFFIPMIVKSLFYGSLLVIGWIQLGVGSVCFLLGIPAIPDVAQSIRNYNRYFEKGGVPTKQELHDMLESGEITKREYDEIYSYMDDKKDETTVRWSGRFEKEKINISGMCRCSAASVGIPVSAK